jgi:pilus assembly protein CpaE
MLTDGGAFYQLLEEFRAAFECSVIDLPRHMLIQHPHLMSDVNVAVVVTELTLAAARDSIRILSWLKSNAPQSRVLVVANRVHAGVPEISRKDFETSIERKVDIVIPFDLRVAAQSAKLGKTLAETAKGSKVGAACASLLDAVIGAADDNDDAGEGKAAKKKKGDSLLGKIGDLKSLIPARKDKATA